MSSTTQAQAPSMTRKHFKMIAATVCESRRYMSDACADTLAQHFAIVLADTNTQFDAVRFMRACGVKDAA